MEMDWYGRTVWRKLQHNIWEKVVSANSAACAKLNECSGLYVVAARVRVNSDLQVDVEHL